MVDKSQISERIERMAITYCPECACFTRSIIVKPTDPPTDILYNLNNLSIRRLTLTETVIMYACLLLFLFSLNFVERQADE